MYGSISFSSERSRVLTSAKSSMRTIAVLETAANGFLVGTNWLFGIFDVGNRVFGFFGVSWEGTGSLML